MYVCREFRLDQLFLLIFCWRFVIDTQIIKVFYCFPLCAVLLIANSRLVGPVFLMTVFHLCTQAFWNRHGPSSFCFFSFVEYVQMILCTILQYHAYLFSCCMNHESRCLFSSFSVVHSFYTAPSSSIFYYFTAHFSLPRSLTGGCVIFTI